MTPGYFSTFADLFNDLAMVFFGFNYSETGNWLSMMFFGFIHWLLFESKFLYEIFHKLDYLEIYFDYASNIFSSSTIAELEYIQFELGTAKILNLATVVRI